MARRRQRAPFNVSRWHQVRARVLCMFGHDIHAGEWAYFGPVTMGTRAAICEHHMREHYRQERPTRPVVLTQGFDVRARRLGEPE